MRVILFLVLFLLPFMAKAQPTEEATANGPRITQLHLETRVGWEGYNVNGNGDHDNTGFKGQFLNLRFDGQLYKNLTFSYRQRLSKQTGQTFWDATDWLHLDWRINRRWGVSAGKQVVAIGGYEYDRAPIDLYYCSEFWYNIACYQLGVSGSFWATPHDQLLLQVCNSPFRTVAGNNTYGINLLWSGRHGCWETLYSFNAFQRQRGNEVMGPNYGKWMYYIALGNRFKMGKFCTFDIDFTNRAANHQAFLFKDMTIGAELSVQPHASTHVFAKYTYDQNHSGTSADYLVTDGTEMHAIGGGVEVQPLKNYRDGLRLFATATYNWGTNTNPVGTKRDKEIAFQAGLKFRLDILDAFSRIMKRTTTKE